MANVLDPVDAIRTAFKMLKELIIKIGIHRGPAISVPLNERLNYFGQRINIACRIQELADAQEIFITPDVYLSPGVQEILKDGDTESAKARLKGIQEEMVVYKLR